MVQTFCLHMDDGWTSFNEKIRNLGVSIGHYSSRVEVLEVLTSVLDFDTTTELGPGLVVDCCARPMLLLPCWCSTHYTQLGAHWSRTGMSSWTVTSASKLATYLNWSGAIWSFSQSAHAGIKVGAREKELCKYMFDNWRL